MPRKKNPTIPRPPITTHFATRRSIHRKRKPNWIKRAARVRVFQSFHFSNRTNFDKSQKAAISRLYADYKRVRTTELHKIKSRSARKALRDQGYKVTNKGVIIPALRDTLGKRLKGQRVRVSERGKIVISYGKQRGYFFSIIDKKEFLKDPAAWIKKHRPGIKGKSTVKLVYGSFESPGGIEIDALNQYIDEMLPAHIKTLNAVKYTTYIKRRKRKIHK